MNSVLQVSGLGRRFGGLVALSDVDMDLHPKEILGLIGPNGAGKTTCFSLISGSLKPSTGKVLLKGHNITGMSPHRIVSRGLARTFQSATIYPHATVLENVMHGASLRYPKGFFSGLFNTKRCRQEMDRVRDGAVDILEEIALGKVLDVLGGNLSYGNQKRLGIAIALASQPEVLLLDEPVAGLNPEESAKFGSMISSLRERHGLSILLVEHHMRLVMELCDRLVVLDHGQKLAEGTPTEVSNNRLVIEAYLGSNDDIDY